MSDYFDLIVEDGILVDEQGQHATSIGIKDGCFAKLGDLGGAEAAERFSARGLHILPGVIDTQVHFREPGLTHKEDLETGTLGAIAGGVTAICEMPNTNPPTSDPAALAYKVERAEATAACDFAFFAGATHANAKDLGSLELVRGCAGVKMFMGSSTGNLLVADDDGVRSVLAHGKRRVAVHCEDEDRLIEREPLRHGPEGVHLHAVWRDVETALKATTRLLRIAREQDRQVHVLHITTAEEMDLLRQYRDIATVECTPQHLTLSAPDCYDRLGTFAQMNPPIRDAHHRDALWRAIADGTVHVIGSDHAPHTREEKAQAYPASPSGMTGVQTLLPVMLDHVAKGKLSLERLVTLTSANAARIYNMKDRGFVQTGLRANLSLVDLGARRTISNDWIQSRAGWTPFDGVEVQGWPRATLVGGNFVMRDDELDASTKGRPIAY
ncbi:MAG: dihydroorotase [Planctomycetota bacterium]